MVHVSHLDGAVILERTRLGQQAVLASPNLLDDSAQRLLSMATGYTDLATLAGLLGDLNVVTSLAQDLLRKGLIQVVNDRPMRQSVSVLPSMASMDAC